jgi:hypothetical protein
MRATRSLPFSNAASLCLSWLLLGSPAAIAQSPEPPANTGVVADDMLTLVVGTRFVGPTAEGMSAKSQFTDARIPLSAFNDTDHCVDQSALEVAKEYFATLGRVMGKAGHYYFVPDAEIKKSVAMCERLYGRPPQAWVESKTKVIAFGKVVPTVDAPALEETVR